MFLVEIAAVPEANGMKLPSQAQSHLSPVPRGARCQWSIFVQALSQERGSIDAMWQHFDWK